MKKNDVILDIFWLTLGLGFLFLFFGSDHSLLNPDESRYSEIAREMLASGDYITPRLNGIIFFDKPILYYWQQALSMQWFGVNEWALRFFPSLYGILGCICVYITGHLLFNRTAGIYSALLLASSPFYFLASHYANMDLEVAVLITACLTCFLLAMQDAFTKHRSWLLYLSYAFSALAILTKGLIGIVFPMMIIGAWILGSKRWKIIKQMHLVTGLLLIAVIVSPWFYLVQQANPNFFHYFFTIQHFERFLTSDFNSQSPAWFYLPVVLFGIFPWTLLLIPSLVHAVRRIKQDPNILFLLLWPCLIFIFFSIPKSKLIGYILPVVPPLMIITGQYLAEHIKYSTNWIIRITLFCNLGIAVALFCVPYLPMFAKSPPIHKPMIILGMTLLICTLIIAYCNFRKSSTATWHTMISATFVSLLTLTLIMPMLPIPTNKPLINAVQALQKPDDKIVNYFHYFYDVPLYSQKTVTLVANWDDPGMGRKDNWRRIFLYGLDYTSKNKHQYVKPQVLWSEWNNQKRLFVFTRKAHLDFFKRHANPVVVIAEQGAYAVVSNQV